MSGHYRPVNETPLKGISLAGDGGLLLDAYWVVAYLLVAAYSKVISMVISFFPRLADQTGIHISLGLSASRADR